MAGAGTERPEIVTRLLLAVVLAEAIGIYGLLTSIMLIGKLSTILASYEASMKGLTAGIVMAACGLMASIAIAYTGSAMAGAGVEKPEIVTRTLLAVVLAEALAIYGLLISIMLIGTI
jgi:V-type H+-transporting ATPase proteolipid subunit